MPLGSLQHIVTLASWGVIGAVMTMGYRFRLGVHLPGQVRGWGIDGCALGASLRA